MELTSASELIMIVSAVVGSSELTRYRVVRDVLAQSADAIASKVEPRIEKLLKRKLGEIESRLDTLDGRVDAIENPEPTAADEWHQQALDAIALGDGPPARGRSGGRGARALPPRRDAHRRLARLRRGVTTRRGARGVLRRLPGLGPRAR